MCCIPAGLESCSKTLWASRTYMRMYRVSLTHVIFCPIGPLRLLSCCATVVSLWPTCDPWSIRIEALLDTSLIKTGEMCTIYTQVSERYFTGLGICYLSILITLYLNVCTFSYKYFIQYLCLCACAYVCLVILSVSPLRDTKFHYLCSLIWEYFVQNTVLFLCEVTLLD